MNDGTRQILHKIQGKKTLDMISKEMIIRESTLKARVESLIHQGLLGEIIYGSGCNMCPMNCGSDTCTLEIKMLTLTEKWRKLVDTL